MILRMQEHHNTVSAKRTIGVKKGEVCGFLYLLKTVIAQESQSLTRFQGFSLKMGRGWRAIERCTRPARILVPRSRRFYLKPGKLSRVAVRKREVS